MKKLSNNETFVKSEANIGLKPRLTARAGEYWRIFGMDLKEDVSSLFNVGHKSTIERSLLET